MREAVGIFDVSHLGKALVTGPGAAAYVNATLTNDLGEDRARQGAVHPVLRRRDRRHRRRPDRLPARRRAGLPDPQRGQHRRGRTPARGVGARRVCVVESQHEAYAVLAVQGTRSDEVLATLGLPTGHDYMSFVEASFDGSDRHRLPHRLHRRARLRARRAQRGRRRAVGRAARRRRGVRRAAVRPRRPRHAAHRDGLPAARAGHQPRRHPGAGAARLGGRLEEGRVLGHATCCSPRRRPARRGCCAAWSPPAGASRGRACACCSPPTCRVGEVTSGTFSPTLRKGVGLALIAAQVTDGRGGLGRRPRPPRGLRGHQAARSSPPASASPDPRPGASSRRRAADPASPRAVAVLTRRLLALQGC